MSDIAIRVENLGKQYHIGAIEKNGGRYSYKSLRDSIAGAASAPFRAARALVSGNAHRPQRKDNTFWALKDVSFEVRQGEVVGVIGRNGAGKSTLLKLLSRITEPTAGRAEIHGRIASLLEVGTGFHPELTGRENVYLNGAILGMKRAEIIRNFDAIVAFAEVEKFIDTPVKHYSSGMYLRLAFAVAAHLDTEILLVDEVLAVGDQKFQEKCLGKMQDVASTGRTVFFVSHSMFAIQRLCGRVLVFKSGQLSVDSDPETAVARYNGEDVGSTYTEPPNPSQPTITRAAVTLQNQEFLLTVEYESPFPLVPPVIGFVIYNSLSSPIFGTNTNVDPITPQPEPADRGRFEITIPAVMFRPDRYLISLWLAEAYADHCIREKILAIDVESTVGGDLPARLVGNVHLPAGIAFRKLDAQNERSLEGSGLINSPVEIR